MCISVKMPFETTLNHWCYESRWEQETRETVNTNHHLDSEDLNLAVLSQQAPAQWHSLHTLGADTNWDPGPGVCAVLDQHSLLCHVHHCSVWEFPNPRHYQIWAQAPWTLVSFPGNAWRDRHYSWYLHPTKNVRSILVTFTWNTFWYLSLSDVAYLHRSVYWVGILLAIALNCYVAICDPLRQANIFIHKFLTQIEVGVTLRGGLLIAPCLILIKCQLKHYWTTVVSHSYCEHTAIVKLAAEDIRINNIFGLCVAFSIWFWCNLHHTVLPLNICNCLQTASKGS